MGRETIKISIITASYNAAATIENTISSVMSQSGGVFEHIIIDGGSNDGTLDIIRSYQNAYRLKWISEPDRGIADALNKGVKISKGDYILVLQADDRFYSQNSLKRVSAFLIDGTCDIYSSPVLVEYADGRQRTVKPYKRLWPHHFKTPFRHQGTIVHRRVFDLVGPFSESFSIAMDYDFFYRALKTKPHIVYNNMPLAIMGAYGLGTIEATVRQRLDEEYRVQKKNETAMFWKIVQDLFRVVYLPYKTGDIDLTPIRRCLGRLIK
jgi:glycosyltransferase involved in cell wall biosynthesis